MIVSYLGCFQSSYCERHGDGTPSGRSSKGGVVVRTVPFNLHKISSSSIGPEM